MKVRAQVFQVYTEVDQSPDLIAEFAWYDNAKDFAHMLANRASIERLEYRVVTPHNGEGITFTTL